MTEIRHYEKGEAYISVRERGPDEAGPLFRIARGTPGDWTIHVEITAVWPWDRDRRGRPPLADWLFSAGYRPITKKALGELAGECSDGAFGHKQWVEQLERCLREGTDHTWIKGKPPLNPNPKGTTVAQPGQKPKTAIQWIREAVNPRIRPRPDLPTRRIR